MQQLEEKLATLSDGTEAVAAVMANWGSVLRAVSMASGKWMVVKRNIVILWTIDWLLGLAGIPKPKEEDGSAEGEDEAQQLPNTLVRIPIHQAEAAQREQEKEAAAGAGWSTCCKSLKL
jgi:DASH complex subunit DAD2